MPHDSRRVYTVCEIHNATPGPLTFVKSQDFYGRIGQIPQEISSGRRGLFLHHGEIATHLYQSESLGAVVYRFEDPTGLVCDWMMCWLTLGFNSDELPTRVYTEIMERDRYDVLHLDRIVRENIGIMEGLIREVGGGLQSVYARGGCTAIVTGYPGGKVHGEFRAHNVLI